MCCMNRSLIETETGIEAENDHDSLSFFGP